jgi:hypothetical protein
MAVENTNNSPNKSFSEVLRDLPNLLQDVQNAKFYAKVAVVAAAAGAVVAVNYMRTPASSYMHTPASSFKMPTSLADLKSTFYAITDLVDTYRGNISGGIIGTGFGKMLNARANITGRVAQNAIFLATANIGWTVGAALLKTARNIL